MIFGIYNELYNGIIEEMKMVVDRYAFLLMINTFNLTFILQLIKDLIVIVMTQQLIDVNFLHD